MASPLRHRIALSLPGGLREALQGFADVSEKPVSVVIVELLLEMQPQIEGLTKMQRQIQAGKVSAAKQTLQHVFGDAMARVMQESQPELFKGKKR